jgi:redox-sensitive bicupin YhaK (pirin superfamily)
MNTPLVIRPRAEDVEGQPILRPLPSAQCRSVGPFVFFDHMLETRYPPGKGMNIRQHPHIGLSTLTYLFQGQIQHKDSLGSDQVVDTGDVSWMTAGSAIAHVERTPEALKENGFTMHGLQIWLASPKDHEQGPGHYSHHPAATLPVSENLGVKIRMIAGTGFCLESPVPVLSPTLYAELTLQTATTLLIPTEHEERALYVLSGEVQLDGEPVEPNALVVLPEGEEMTLFAESDCHAVLFGGARWMVRDESTGILWRAIRQLSMKRADAGRPGIGQPYRGKRADRIALGVNEIAIASRLAMGRHKCRPISDQESQSALEHFIQQVMHRGKCPSSDLGVVHHHARHIGMRIGERMHRSAVAQQLPIHAAAFISSSNAGSCSLGTNGSEAPCRTSTDP